MLGRVVRHCRVGLVALCLGWLTGRADVLTGPYVLLEDAGLIRLRFEVDRPDYEVTLFHGEREQTRVEPSYTRGTRDTFLADVVIDLARHPSFRGYEIGRAGEAARRYDWRSRIDGRLREYPRLLVFGDSQGGSRTLAQLAAQWRHEDFDLIVGLGDLADAGSRYESWREEFFEPLRELLPHFPLLAICGNHDSYRAKSLEWFDWYFGRGDRRRYFRIDFADLRLIGLNNSDVHTKYGFDPIDPLTPQYDFLLESALGAGAAGRKLAVFSHIPLYSGSTVVNTEFGSELQRKYVLPILERARVLGFFAGHHHKFERVARPGLRGMIQHLVTGGGGGRLFTAARERGGTTMDREVFEVYHYLTVDFSGEGTVVARALGGEELDRVSFSTASVPVDSAMTPEFWRAAMADDLTVSPTERLGQQLTVHAPPPSGTAEPRSAASAQLYRSERGLIAMARDLARTGAESVSFQGFDWPRKAWSYLQGGSLVVPASGLYGNIALVSLNGADLSPFDRCFPVLHWPLARVRAGLDERAGAVLLLRGRRDFELDPDPDRLVAKWRWGDPVLGVIADEQRARQWSLMDAPPAALPLRQIATEELLRLVAGEAPPEAFVLRAANGPPHAVLVHWPRLRFLAMVAGESLSAGTGTLFLSTDRETRIEIGLADGVRGLRVHRPGKGDTVFLPLGSGRPGGR